MVRSPYGSELVGNRQDDTEIYRDERTEIIGRGGSTSHGHDGHLVRSRSREGHGIHGHKQDFQQQQQHRFGENAVPALVQAFSGAVGSSIANLAVHPLDLVIKRLQVQRQIQNQLRTRRGSQGGVKAPGPRNYPSSSREPHGAYRESSETSVLGLGESDRGERSRTISGQGFTSYQSYTEESRVEWTSEYEVEGQYLGVVDAAQKIYAQEGLAGFYTGVMEETVGTMGSAFWYFAVYSYLRNKRLHKRHSSGLPVLEELLIGFAAGSVSKIFSTPFNTIATRKQTHAMLYPNAKSPGIMDVYEDIMREKGITGFWSGYSASAFLSLNPTITFLLYESIKNFAGGRRRRLRGGETFLIAAVAKAIATGLTYPLAVAKSRAQIANEDDDLDTGNLLNVGKAGGEIKKMISRKARRSGNVIEVLADIFKREGIAALYEGVLGELLRGLVSSGITMVIKESVHRTIISLYYFVMRAYNRTEDHTFHSTTKLMAKDAYDKAGPRQKKLINKAIEGAEKVESIASHGKSKVAGLVGAGHVAEKLSEVREKITEHTGIGKYGGMKAAAAATAAAGLAAGAAHAHNRNERHDEHGNVIVHTARERVEEWREGVGEDSNLYTGKVTHSGHVVDDRIHTGEMRQDVHETRTHTGSGHVGSRIGRNHNGVTEHIRIEERVEHDHSGTGSHGRRGPAAGVAGVVAGAALGHKLSGHGHSGHTGGAVGAVTGAALGHKLSSHHREEHSHSGHGAGAIGTATGATLGHKLSGHSHNEHSHSGHGGHGAGVVGTVAGAALGHKLSSHNHNEHSHSSHGGHGAGVVGTVAGAALGHKLLSHGHSEQSHSGHGGHGAGVVGTVAGAALGHKLSSHNHNEHSHSSHGGHGAGVVGTVAGAALGHKLLSHGHSEQSHSGHGGHGAGVVGTVAGAALGHKLLSHGHNEHSHSGHGGHGAGVVGTVAGAALGHKLLSHGHSEHSHSGHGGHGAGVVGTVAGAALGHKLSSHSHHGQSHSGHGGHGAGVVGTVAGAALGHKLLSHSHNEHSHSSHGGHGAGVVGTVAGAALGHKLLSHGHSEHSHSGHGGHGAGVVGTVAGAALGHKLLSHGHNEHSHSGHGGHGAGVVGTVAGAALGHKLSSHSHNEHSHGGDVITQTTTNVEEFDIVKNPRVGNYRGGHQADSRARFEEDSYREHTFTNESRGREHEGVVGAVTGHNYGRSHSGNRHNSDLVHKVTGTHGHGHGTHGRDGQVIIHSETVKEWRDEANAVEDLRQFGVASTVHEDSRSDFGETLHKGHSIVGHGHSNRFGDDAVVHDGHTVVEKTQITRIGETLHDGGHHSHSHGHRHNESSSDFGGVTLHGDGRTVIEKTEVTRIDENIHDGGHRTHGHRSHRHNQRHNDSALHTDGRTIVEKTQVTRIGETSRDGHSHNVIPTRSPISRLEDAEITKVVEKTQVTQFGETYDAGRHQHHRNHSSHGHGSNGTIVGKAGYDNAATRTSVRETGWLGKKALVNNAASINTAAATAGTSGVTTVTRTEEFWPVDEDARSSVYNFLDEESKEVSGGVSVVETRTAEERWWDDKRGKGYN